MFNWLGRRLAKNPVLGVCVWIVLFLVAAWAMGVGFGSGNLFERLKSETQMVEGSDSAKAHNIIEENDPNGLAITYIISGIDLTDQQKVTQISKKIKPILDQAVLYKNVVKPAFNPFTLPGGIQNPVNSPLISTHKDGFITTVYLQKGLSNTAEQTAHKQVIDTLNKLPDSLRELYPNVQGEATSRLLISDDMAMQVRSDLLHGEAIGLPVALFLMVLFFSGLLAAGIPLIGALVSITIGIGMIYLATIFTAVDSFIINVISIIGLGISIDYGLLLVSRFREEARRILVQNETKILAKNQTGPAKLTRRSLHRKQHKEKSKDQIVVEKAVTIAVSTAGRTITFSALTIVFALSGIFIMRSELLKIIGAALVIVVLLAVITAATLLPAIIRLLGVRLLKKSVITNIPGIKKLMHMLGDVPPQYGVFSRLARSVQKKPWIIFACITTLLLVFASPLVGIQIRNSVAEIVPSSSKSYQVLSELADDYPYSRTPDVTLVAESPLSNIGSLQASLEDIKGVKTVSAPVALGNEHTIVNILTEDTDAVGQINTQIIRDIRQLDLPYKLLATGPAAFQIDFNDSLSAGMPWALLMILLSVFVLLFLMTGSLIVPIKALLINSLSLAASLGITTWLFEGGHLGLEKIPGLQSYVVAIVIAFGFGLAMDYEVFLLARVKEFWDRGNSNDQAMRRGIQQSGRIITSAAAIIVAVFLGFVTGQMLAVKQVGVALAVSVLVDATLVRMILVPATMTLLGKWNWWAPKCLRWIYYRFGLEEDTHRLKLYTHHPRAKMPTVPDFSELKDKQLGHIQSKQDSAPRAPMPSVINWT